MVLPILETIRLVSGAYFELDNYSHHSVFSNALVPQDFTELGFGLVDLSHRKYSEATKRTIVNEYHRRRRIGDLPPAFPNGWFVILESDQLKSRGVQEVSVLGLNLVAWRGESGKTYVADAYCPHLGAHLGVGGKVSGECITCPFHGWQFRGDTGCLARIPYAENISK